MKKLVLISAAIAAILAGPADAADARNPRSPSRYLVLNYPFSTTTSISGARVAVLPAGMKLACVVVCQNAAGTGGTSWAATPRANGTALVSTAGGFTLAAGASKVTSSARCPLGEISLPSGGTRPVIAGNVNATGTITVSASITDGQLVTIGGITYTAKTAAGGPREFTLSGVANTDAARLAAIVNADPGSPVVASVSTNVVTIAAKATGTNGNAITLTKTGAQLAVSGAVLSGGADARSSPATLVTMDVTLTGSYSVAVSGVVTLYFDPAI